MTCAKQSVACCLLDEEGQVVSVGSNWCKNPQEECPRKDFPTGRGYEMCGVICGQHAHAEVDALENLDEDIKPKTCILIGHYYCCQGCKEELKRRGIENFIIVKEMIIE